MWKYVEVLRLLETHCKRCPQRIVQLRLSSLIFEIGYKHVIA
ncbi:MAG: hypothetical protein WA875_13820 [Candidatus Acidiferrales bacterium]